VNRSSRVLATALALVCSLGLMAVPAASSAPQQAVIVQAPGAETSAAAAVERLGGTVTGALPIVSGFAATLPGDAVAELRAVPGVRAVTADTQMHPTKGKPPSTSKTPNSVYRTEIGADALSTQGFTGDGVRVALVDTGVDTAVATSGDLAGRVVSVANPNDELLPDVACVNFSGEATCDDTFGHGTFMAGLIAGSGAASAGKYAGVAPDAEIVSVKVGGADGSADVSKVLAGIQWVVSFADDYDIKVLNLSMGTDSTAPPSLDPLNLAVQRAWVEGITVVVSAGNFGAARRTRPDGSTYGTVTKPGDDPYVITVGAVDDMETPAVSDDRLPAFSSWGPTFAGHSKPDITAPGARVISLRAPGSVIDGLGGTVNATYRRGSGTSMAAAVVSGLTAQLLEAESTWQPDDVKAALAAGALSAASNNTNAVGDGLAHGPSALAASISPTYRTVELSTGLGLLDVSRGTNRVLSCVSGLMGCLLLAGENTAQGRNWQGLGYAMTSWTSETWYLSQWVADPSGRNWQASTWPSGRNWQGADWQGSTYFGGAKDKRSYGKPVNGSGSYGSWG
jgi:serine protease AprX